MSWVGVAIGGGAAVLGGSFLQGQSQRSQANKAQNFYWDRTDEGAGRLGRFAFGDDYFQSMWNGTAGDSRPGGYVGSLYGQADESRSLGDALITDYNQRFGNLARASQDQINRVGSIYDREQAGVLSRGRDAESLAAQFGRDRENVIRDENLAQREAAQAQARAQLNASGFGASSERAVRGAGINQGYDRDLNSQLANVADTRLSAQMNARGQTNQLAAGIGSQRAGTTANMYESDIARRYNVSAAFPQLATQLQNRNFALENQAGQAGLGILSGATFNPWLNTNVSAFYPGGSPVGGALQSAGSTAGALGMFGALGGFGSALPAGGQFGSQAGSVPAGQQGPWVNPGG